MNKIYEKTVKEVDIRDIVFEFNENDYKLITTIEEVDDYNNFVFSLYKNKELIKTEKLYQADCFDDKVPDMLYLGAPIYPFLRKHFLDYISEEKLLEIDKELLVYILWHYTTLEYLYEPEKYKTPQYRKGQKFKDFVNSVFKEEYLV